MTESKPQLDLFMPEISITSELNPEASKIEVPLTEDQKYHAEKADRVRIEREERKQKKAGTIFHRSTKRGPTGRPIGVTFVGKCDTAKAEKLAKRAEKVKVVNITK